MPPPGVQPNPFGQLGPGQGFLSRPGMGTPSVQTGTQNFSDPTQYPTSGGTPSADYTAAMRSFRSAAPGTPNGAVAPGSRTPYGPSGGMTGRYTRAGAQPGDFYGGPGGKPNPTLKPSMPGLYGTAQAGQYVDAQGRPVDGTDAGGQGSSTSTLISQRLGLAPEETDRWVMDRLSAQAQMQDPGFAEAHGMGTGGIQRDANGNILYTSALQQQGGTGGPVEQGGQVPGGTGPKPAGSAPPGGGTWADYGFVQQQDGSWAMPSAPPRLPPIPPPQGQPPPQGGQPPPVAPPRPPATPPNSLPTGGVEPGAVWNPTTRSWERNIEAGGSNFEQSLRASGSPYAGDPFKLPGKPDAMYAGLESYRNLAGEQYGRASESEALWAELMGEMAGGPGLAAAGRVASDLAADPYTTSSDAMRDRLERRGLEEIETGRNATRNRMADLGIASGPSGADAIQGAEGAANRQRTDYLMALDDEFAKRKAADQAAALKGARDYGDVYQQARVTPAAAYAGMLRQPLEPYRETLADLYTQIGTFQSEEALANKPPRTMDYLAPILGSVIQGVLS